MSEEPKKNPMEFLNKPPFLIGGGLFALLSGLMGWIAYEYMLICVVAAVVGVVLYYKKNKKS